MSLKTKLVLVGIGALSAIGIAMGVELYRLHKHILKELVAIRKQGERRSE